MRIWMPPPSPRDDRDRERGRLSCGMRAGGLRARVGHAREWRYEWTDGAAIEDVSGRACVFRVRSRTEAALNLDCNRESDSNATHAVRRRRTTSPRARRAPDVRRWARRGARRAWTACVVPRGRDEHPAGSVTSDHLRHSGSALSPLHCFRSRLECHRLSYRSRTRPRARGSTPPVHASRRRNFDNRHAGHDARRTPL